MQKIIPTILTPNINELKDKLQKLQYLSNWVDIDIIDGKCVDNKTIQFQDLQNIKILKNFKAGFHLMVKNPLNKLAYAKAIGAIYFISQIKEVKNQQKFIDRVKKAGLMSGLALDMNDSLKEISKKVLSQLDIILIMPIIAGWSGQKFQPKALEKIRKLKSLKVKNGYKYKIALDGGINKNTISQCAKAGADIFFVNSAVWKNGTIKKNLKELKKSANKNF
jgi:ribulose-phosphate 3-epimerase